MPIPRSRSERGFSLIELIIIVAVVAVLVLIVGPAVQRFTLRAKMRSSAQALAVHLQKARLTSIQTNQRVVAEIDPGGRALRIWADVNGPIDGDPPDLVYNPLEGFDRLATDHVVQEVPLETNVFFGGPDDQPTTGLTPVGSDRNVLLFFPNGSVSDPGSFNLGFRVGDGETVSGNFLQINVSPAATGRTVVRKWNGSAWREHREGGQAWVWTTP